MLVQQTMITLGESSKTINAWSGVLPLLFQKIEHISWGAYQSITTAIKQNIIRIVKLGVYLTMNAASRASAEGFAW
jgi:hypothetical protein